MSPRITPLTRAALVAASGLAAIVALTGCGTGETAATGKTDLIIAVQDDPVCLDPQQVTITTALNIGRQIVDSLLDQNPDTGELVPWLASAYETNDDLTAFTFTIRDGVTFSDGSALTAETVKTNFDALFAMGKTASLASQYLAGYTESTVDGDKVTVTFSAPNAQFLQGASTITLGLLSDASAAQTPEERCATPVGSGPFTVDTYTANDSVVIERREGYDWPSKLRKHTGDAAMKTITFAITPEPAVRTGGLQTGDYDVILDLPAVDEKRFDTDDYTIFARANPGIPHSLVPNTERPIVSDDAVRHAMLLATDRAEISELTGSSKVPAASGALSSSTPGFVSEEKALKTDLAAAKKLLDDAGWVEGSDGVRTKDGQRLSVSVTAFYGKDVLEAAQIQLAKAGIELKINMVTAGDFFGAIGTRDYDFLGAGLTRTDPDVLRVMFQQGGANWAVVADPELEKLLGEQAQQADNTARMKTVGDIQNLVIENADLVPLLEVAQVHAARAGITGLEFDSSSRIVLYDLSTSE